MPPPDLLPNNLPDQTPDPRAQEVPLDAGDAPGRLRGDQVDAHDDAARAHAVRGHLRPRPGRVPEVDDRLPVAEEPVPRVHLQQLEGGAALEALHLGRAGVPVAGLARVPLGVC
ncbi:rRNA methyltransferase 2, mitochondrial [Cytospora mali]|uniref:rRNA methyltransferase 2, mitochondrial n=1 Tax=Cytospora mali TaxID=578113 RepID=A0A194UY76_CYTMA|nr:rRNA methyltransferase 2, mitochondrial [Valsa mali var. pyri (nom. inval.)]